MFGIGQNELWILIIGIVVFLICREIVCWYWKQNEQVKLLKEIRDLLKGKQIVAETIQEKELSPEHVQEINTAKVKCWDCGSVHPQGTQICPNCGVQFTITDIEVAKENKKTWKCTCGTENDEAISNCSKCSKFKPMESRWS